MKQALLSFVFIVFALSLSAQSGQRGDVQIYPNPAVDYIEVSENPSLVQVTIFNLVGREVRSYHYNEKERYYIGDLPRGMYLVQLTDNRNKIVTTQRINKR